VFGRLDAEARLFGGVRFWALAVGFLGASSSPRLDAAGGAGVLGPRGCFLAWWSFPPCFFVGAPGSLLEAFSSPQPGAAGEACAFWASGRVGPGVLFGRPAGVFSALPCLWGSARTLGIGDASLSLLERVRSDLLRYPAPRASPHLPEPLFERTRFFVSPRRLCSGIKYACAGSIVSFAEPLFPSPPCLLVGARAPQSRCLQ